MRVGAQQHKTESRGCGPRDSSGSFSDLYLVHAQQHHGTALDLDVVFIGSHQRALG
jgi:hypothetical protein